MAEHNYFHVLDLNYYEVANSLKHKISAKFSTKDAAKAFVQARELMNLYSVHGFSEVVSDAITFALELNITVYDAAFLSLADTLDLRLLTLDAKLAKKLECTKYGGLFEYPDQYVTDRK